MSLENSSKKLINEDLGDDMNIIQPDYLGRCLSSVTDKNETILNLNNIITPLKKPVCLQQTPNKNIETNGEKVPIGAISIFLFYS